MKDRKIKQVLSRVGYWWEGEDIGQVKERKYGGTILYSCMKIEQ
jgi:hypothetical protein